MFSTHTIALLLLTASHAGSPDLIVVQGAGGADDYQQQFTEWSETWVRTAGIAGAQAIHIGGDKSEADDSNDRTRLEKALATASQLDQRPLWLVLIGHGTFDGRDARFNLVGPDISDHWLAEQLVDCRRPLAVVCCFSSSAPFLNRLSGEGRVIITATRSGAERNFSRFGGYIAEAVADSLPTSLRENAKATSKLVRGEEAAGEAQGLARTTGWAQDLDKDGQTSLLELFLYASKRTSQFYADDQRLATEHALMDDNGDRRGTPAEWFRGIHPTRAPKEGELDGLMASQQVLVAGDRERGATAEFLEQRNSLERQLAELKKRRTTMPEDAYYQQLEPLMIQLARLYAKTE